MKTFSYEHSNNSDLLNTILKYQGKLEFHEENNHDNINALKKNALIDETYYSTKIEGIILDYKKCKEIIKNIGQNNKHAVPGDVSDFEKQFEGYSKVLMTINKRLDFFNIDTTSILAMFYALYNIPANYKKSVYRKNDYQEVINNNDILKVKVSPVDSYETPLYLGSAVSALNLNFNNNPKNIAKFIVDFMCIRPFDVGTGRIARLFMYMLLLKAQINVVKYVSMSKIFEANAAHYYESITLCCNNWDKNNNTYEPFIEYFLNCIIKAYDILFKTLSTKKLKKQDQIFEFIKAHPHKITKQQIKEAFPNISLSTIETSLHKLKEEGKIIQIAGGRSAYYKLNLSEM